MKKRVLLLVVFMLTLFILPAFDGTSSLTDRPNKAYYSSDAWEEIGNATVGFHAPDWEYAGNASVGFQTTPPPSPQSIGAFAETLPDDELFYPDTFYYDPLPAFDGDTGYENASSMNGIDFTTGAWSDLIFSSVREQEEIESFTYHIYVTSATSAGVDLKLYHEDSDTTILVVSNIGSVGWHNGTLLNTSFISNESIITAIIHDGADTADVDYFGIGYSVMTLAGADHYAESFSNVSDWSKSSVNGLSDPAHWNILTDGDVMEVQIYCDAASLEYVVVASDMFVANLTIDSYYEVRFMVEPDCAINIRVWDSTGVKTYINDQQGDGPDVWQTMKFYLDEKNLDDVYKIDFIVQDHVNAFDGGWISAYFDYARIGSANETGWQHDASTTASITNSLWCDVSTDGDNLNFTATDSIEYADIHFDTTTTSANGEISYYPFVEFNITAVNDGDSDGNIWALNIYDSDADYLPSGYQSTTGIFRYNILSDPDMDDVDFFRFYLQDSGDSIVLDYIKLYSIANYTVTQSGTSTDDVLYVSDDILYSNIDSGEIVLDYDPELSITSPYHSWELNTTQGTPQTSIYTEAWSSYTSNTTGAFPHNETLSDFRLKLTDNTTINGIIFGFALDWVEMAEAHLLFRGVTWNDIVSAIIKFQRAIFVSDFQWFFILAGLIMIPASTLFLVRGGKDDLSRDKIFLFLIIFLFGCAFFLGGIM